MRALLLILVLLSSLFSSYSFAHSDKLKRMDHSSHGHMNDKTAISVVIQSVKKMAFRDLGYEVGLLPVSWENITVADVTLFSVTGDVYIVSAINAEINKTLYFQIADDGDVMAVSETNAF
jgi:hypothetical protein